MKATDITKIMARSLGTSNVEEINKLLKDKNQPQIKYRIVGKKLGHFGFTGFIKNISKEGLKVFETKKVSLIRFEEIEVFEIAKPRSERQPANKKVEPKKPLNKKPESAIKARQDIELDEDELEFAIEDDEGFVPKKRGKKKKHAPTTGKTGSKFIPQG